ncbi:MAG: hypothetical protein LBL28_04075 [Treponema sp.]|jgi:hypothetical protein|nr:hypothetical protein [Treponema sp.]
MTITINGKPADIILETEKNVGDILAGLDNWLQGSGYRLSGLEIDGETAPSGSLEVIFDRELANIKTLDIRTSSLVELMAEALLNTRDDMAEYAQAGFEEKKSVTARWRQSPAACFLSGQIPEIYQGADKTFSGEGFEPGEFQRIIDERLRELEDPAGELNRAEPLLEGLVRRLEDLPLDIQTGKDSRAVETIQIFSNVAEKVFRIFNLLRAGGLDTSALKVDDVLIADYIEEFGAALRELLAAYETRDAVLVGDLAEYELAPRLRKLYAVMRNPIVSPI